MPVKPPTPCTQAGCPRRAVARGRCELHQRPQHSAPRGTTTEQGYGWAWQRVRVRWLREHSLCCVCGAPAVVVDHIVPRRLGGSDDESNYQSMCERCHNSKRARERAVAISAQQRA